MAVARGAELVDLIVDRGRAGQIAELAFWTVRGETLIPSGKINEPDMNAQDRTLQEVTASQFAAGRPSCGPQVESRM